MTIAEFLLARIAEDEAGARAATPGRWFRDSGWSISAPAPEGWDGPYVVVETPRARNDSEFITRYDPARVLAECAAKRAIVELAGEASMIDDSLYIEVGTTTRDLASEPYIGDRILSALAAVYADHPDYLQGWAL